MAQTLTTDHRLPEAVLPETVSAAFEPASSESAALAFTRRLANGHYENFSVVSALLPSKYRQDFCNVYAFCRVADDLGDEIPDKDQSLRMLEGFRRQTERMYAGSVDSLVFTALSATVRKYDIPIRPFLDLIDAFKQDQRVNRYDTFDQLKDYCRRSADPVGRLVLYMAGVRDEARQQLSDHTCTALQVTNFWQDVRRDVLDRDRIYLPAETMDRFGVTRQQIVDGRCDQNYRDAISFEVDRAREYFHRGEALLPLLPADVRPQVALFGRGGVAILDAIAGQNFDTLSRRPTLSKMAKGSLVARVLVGKLINRLTGSTVPGAAA